MPKKSTKTKNPNGLTNFNDEDVDVYIGLEAVRNKYDMYIGSSEPAIQLFKEGIDNSIDEFLNGFGDTIDVILDTKENRMTIKDRGRGLPLGMNTKLNKSNIEVLFTHLHSSGKYGKNVVKTSAGKNGVGIKCITALSSILEVTSIRQDDGVNFKKGTMSFSKGKILEPLKIFKITKPKKTTTKGTTISFIPDESIFGEDAKFNIDRLSEILDLKAYLNGGLKINFIVDDNKTVFYHKNGIFDYLRTKIDKPLFNMDTIYFKDTDSDDNEYEFALSFNNDTEETMLSFVNSLQIESTGTQGSGFKKGLTQVFNDYIKENGLLSNKDKNLSIKGEDIRRGLVTIISIKHDNPLYESQTKSKLTNSNIDSIVRKIIIEHVGDYFKKNPKIAKALCERAIAFAKATNSAKEKMKKIVNVNQGSLGLQVTEKFMDCESENPEEVEIFVVEGNSAKGGVEDGRFSKFQCIYPLRGKILNTEGATSSRIMENKELNEFLKIEFGSNDLKKIRENLRKIIDGDKSAMNTIKSTKIIILCDADSDGKHITILFLNFIYEHLPELIELGWIYIGTSPFYRVNINGKWRYFINNAEYSAFKTEVIENKYKVLTKGLNVETIVAKSKEFNSKIENFKKENSISNEVLNILIRNTDSKEVKKECKELGNLKTYKSGKIMGMYDNIWHDFNVEEVLDDPDLEDIRKVYNITEVTLKDKETGEKITGDIYDIVQELLSVFKYSRNRIKGLGELNGDELRLTSLDPKTRNLIRVIKTDEKSEKELFKVLFGNNPDLRKEFIKKYI